MSEHQRRGSSLRCISLAQSNSPAHIKTGPNFNLALPSKSPDAPLLSHIAAIMTSLFGAPGTNSQNASSPFGPSTLNLTTNNQKPNLFGSLNINANPSTSNTFGAFGATAASSSSAPANTATSGKSLFDRITPADTTQASSGPSIFGTTAPVSQAKPANSIFGVTTQSPQQTTSIFGNMGQQNQQNQQSQGGGLFGSLSQSNQQSTQPQGGGLFGSMGGSTQQKSQGTTMLGGSTLLGGGSSIFGQSANQQNQQQSVQQQGGNSLFGGLAGLGQGTQQQQQQPTQQGAFGQSILAPQTEIYPRLFLRSLSSSHTKNIFRNQTSNGPDGNCLPEVASSIPLEPLPNLSLQLRSPRSGPLLRPYLSRR